MNALNGDQGPKGPRGDRGDRGNKGPKGQQGDEGKQGRKGRRGKRGDRGARGAVGEPGVAGHVAPPSISRRGIWALVAVVLFLIVLGLAEPIIIEHWPGPSTTRSSPNTTSISDQMAGMIEALVAVIGLLVAAAGASAFLALRDRIHGQVESQLAQETKRQSTVRTLEEIRVDLRVEVVFWTDLDILMRVDSGTLSELQREHRQWLTISADRYAVIPYRKSLTLEQEATSWEDHGDHARGLNDLRFAVLNFAFYRACRVVVEWQDGNRSEWPRAKALEAIDALDYLEHRLVT